MTQTTTKHETLSERAYLALKARILDGEFQPGDRLSLRPVAKSLGVSLAPVNDALRELTRDGLIEMEPRWGARVRRLDASALRNQHILRTALECEAVRQCVSIVGDALLDEQMELAQKLDNHIDRDGDPKQIRELDSRFHLRIAQLSGAASLAEALKANQLVRLLAVGSLIAHEREKPKRQHISLVEAIQTREPDKAESAMRAHCLHSMKLQLDNMAMSDPAL